VNVMADSLATEYYNNADSRNRPSSNPLFFPSCRVSLSVNGQRITAKPAAAIRFHINGTNQRRYLQQTKPAWHHNNVWNSIDFEALGSAYKTLAPSNRTNISKMLHGWMNTGVQRAKITLNTSSNCPRCGYSPEDQDHILLCRGHTTAPIRHNAIVALQSQVVTRRGGSRTWKILHACLYGMARQR
jgi:hypothetical protein